MEHLGHGRNESIIFVPWLSSFYAVSQDYHRLVLPSHYIPTIESINCMPEQFKLDFLLSMCLSPQISFEST